MRIVNIIKKSQLALLCAAVATLSYQDASAKKKDAAASQKFVHTQAGNPYLPLWEHVPDGEPKVFEDPDNPGKYRAYIIGSHDVRYGSYCGPDIRAWSAPVEDLTKWRDEGPIFTYHIDNQWDVMYAPDLVEVKMKDGTKKYYLYPHSRGPRREAMVCVGDRPDGPFTPLNLTEDGRATTPGSVIGFDPSVFIEYVTDPNDPDYEIGFRAYAFWGFQHSTAAQLDQKTMYSVRPGTERVDPFIPASSRYGVVREPAGTQYPALYKEQNPGDFNFFEASSIRQVGNKYVMVFSGYSGPDYGLGSTNSALRYAFGDSPLGPWRSGGVLVDSRGVVVNEDGSKLMTSNAAHNTHGSLELINDQWYVFYHRPPRGFGNARQAMVAPVKIEWDEKSVADGGIVTITGYNPYAENEEWIAEAANGDTYRGAEVTSEGFHIFGLDPYDYYSAGYACFMTNGQSMQDTWDMWDNSMDLVVKNSDIIGFKYFGFGGLDKDTKGIKAFKGTAPKNKTKFNVFIAPKTNAAFKIKVMLDAPWKNSVWSGKEIGTIQVPANASKDVTCYTIDVAQYVDNLDGKHAIYLIAEGNGNETLFELEGIGFSKGKKQLVRPVAPTVTIKVGGQVVELPETPVRSTNRNGIVEPSLYEANVKLAAGQSTEVTASADNKAVDFEITQIEGKTGTAVVKAVYNGVVKTFNIVISE